MDDGKTLEFFLQDVRVGYLTSFPGDRNLWVFDESYARMQQRPILGLAFEDVYGDLIDRPLRAQLRLPAYFSNLLPEGPLREFLARKAQIHPQKEFLLLRELAQDLPGALRAGSSNGNRAASGACWDGGAQNPSETQQAYHFSLAGLQLKFSGELIGRDRLTITADGASGAWIVKLPSIAYPHVPENEFAMMDLARRVGIDVPETALLPLTAIQGLPAEIPIPRDTPAYIIRRFDRRENGQRVHTEDFAQVFGVYPERKYEAASYRNIAEAVFSACGDLGLAEFIRRLTFNILIGNGDMHLKNWSLIYFDGRHPSLAPAYDFVSTICYLPQDKLALSLLDSKEFSSLSTYQLKRWAGKSGFPESLVLDVAEDTARRLALVWPMLRDYTLPGSAVDVLEKHIASIPLWRSIL